METCSVAECETTTYARSLCRKHYDWQRQRGTTDPPPPIEERRRAQAEKVRKYNGPCAVDECERPAVTRGWCQPHYMRWRRTGEPGAGRIAEFMSRDGKCSIEDCEGGVYARGWCIHHYENNRLRGDPLATGPGQGKRPYPPKWEGAICAVEGCERDDVLTAGYCRMHYNRWQRTGDVGPAQRLKGAYGEGWVTRHGYRSIPHPRRPGRQILEHRLVMEQVLGRELEGTENVHHINGQRADNRPENLELWVTAQPSGQRVEDVVAWMREYIAAHEADVAALAAVRRD